MNDDEEDIKIGCCNYTQYLHVFTATLQKKKTKV